MRGELWVGRQGTVAPCLGRGKGRPVRVEVLESPTCSGIVNESEGTHPYRTHALAVTVGNELVILVRLGDDWYVSLTTPAAVLRRVYPRVPRA